MKRLIFSALVLSAVTANAQVKNGMVGINTDEPRATMHIETGVSESKGLIIPRITAAQMKTMTSLAHFGADHHAIITYLKETLPLADRTGKLVDVAEPGYYFYNHTAAKWQKFGGGAGQQDLRYINNNHITQDAGIGGNGTSLGSATSNIAIGPNTFYGFTNPADLSGSTNIAMGNSIYYSNGGTMQANGNTGIGSSLFQMTSGGTMQGARNVALGNSIYNLSKANAQFTGHSNFGIGQSLFILNNGDLTGGGNFAMGVNHFSPNNGDLTGNNNIGIGSNQFSPSNGNVTGGGNLAIGSSSIFTNSGNIGGNDNMGIGSSSINIQFGSLRGHNNIALGYSSMDSSGDFTGNYNVVIGNDRVLNGGSSGISGSYNVAIGNGNHYTIGGGNGNIVIVSGTGTDTPGILDNAVLIGSGSWGALKDGTTAISASYYNAPVLLGSGGSKVGVGGITTPQAKLDVNGGVKVGYDNSVCTSTNKGTIRFNNHTNKFQGCDGTDWINLH